MNTKEPTAISIPLQTLVATHLIGAVEFGKIIISYEHGKPVHVERREGFRLTGTRDKS